jgi:hypothetical protein
MQATPSPHSESSHPYRVKLLFFGQNRLPNQLLRQSPASKGIWKGLHFDMDGSQGPADFLVVFGSGHPMIRENIAKENTLFIGSEPPAIKTYPEGYLGQFYSAICSDPDAIQPNLKLSQQGYPWFCGLGYNHIKTYDDYKVEKTIEKTKLISVVCSSKQTKPGHRKRFEFVQRLKEIFPDDLDLYGAGQNYVEDKADAVRPYKYHITIENSISPHYWSEKLADAYLEGAFPLYSGCPNLDQYFSPDAFRLIDIEDLDSTVATIRQCIEEDLYSRSTEALYKAKQQIIDQYNLFNVIAEHLEERGFPKNPANSHFTAYPGKWFRKGRLYKLKFGLKQIYYRLK